MWEVGRDACVLYCIVQEILSGSEIVEREANESGGAERREVTDRLREGE